jgi:acyl-CoA thioester hydrolase
VSDAVLEPYDLRISVAPADIDEQGHVNNVVYLRWAQEAAIAHWQALAPPEAQQNTGWVVVRHEIDYHAPARANEEVIARTWVGHLRGAVFERHTEMRRAAGDLLLAKVRSLWVPIDPATERPKRLPMHVRRMFSARDRS